MWQTHTHTHVCIYVCVYIYIYIFFLNGLLKVKVKVNSLSHVQFFATPYTVAYQAALSMGFSRQ